MVRHLAAASIFVIATALSAQAQAPAPAAPPAAAAAPTAAGDPSASLIAPSAPTLAAANALPAVELARGYLAAVAAIPLAEAALLGQGIVDIGIDGKPYVINAANAQSFADLLDARKDVFGKAIAARGAPNVDGQYALAAGPGCKGDKLDPRQIFSPGKAPDGTVLMANTAEIITSGIETDMLITLAAGRQTMGVVISGTAVGDTLILTNVLNEGFSLYGSISPNTISLRFDPDEVKDAVGVDAGTAADWVRLEACVFTLTKKK